LTSKKLKQEQSLQIFKPRYLRAKIPSEWKLIELKDIVTYHNSGVFKNQEFYGNGENIVGVSDLYNNTKINGQIFSLVQLNEEEKKDKILEEGDLIYGESSLVRIGIGKTIYVTKKGAGTIFSWHTRRFKINDEALSIFIYYALESPFLRKSLISRSTTTALTGITTKEYFGTKIVLPTINEQKKISSILSNIDDVINKYDSVIESTKKLKKGAVQHLLTKGIGHKKFKKVKWYFGKEIEIPEEWEVMKFKHLCKVRQGLQIPISERFEEPGSNRLQYITVKSIHSGKFEEFIENPGKRVICTEHDVLFTRTGNTGEIITNIKGVFHNNFFLIDFDRKIMFKDYLVTSLEQQRIQEIIISLAGSTTIPDLNHSDFFRLMITVPPLEEQKKIASILNTVDSKISDLESKKSSLEQLKKGFMQKLLTGKIRVTV